MVKLYTPFLLVASSVWMTSTALQVTPNSNCAAICMDDATQDRSDPNVSNTFGSDIVCRDQSYANPVGQKFEKCVSCLQNSTSQSTTESDLQWFLYNLRFAFNACIFGLSNTTEPISTPCSIKSSCGPLIGSMQDGMDNPRSANRYSYCSAFQGSFTGPQFAPCHKCLLLTNEQRYVGNFLIALQAGCAQLPEVGSLIGIDGHLFSNTPVNITSKAKAPTTTNETGGLKYSAYIGIGVAGLVVILIIAAFLIVCTRKRKNRRRHQEFASRLNDHYGNQKPAVLGSYNDPYAVQKNSVPVPSPYNESKSMAYYSPDSIQTPFNPPTVTQQHNTPSYPLHQNPPSNPANTSQGLGVSMAYNPGNIGNIRAQENILPPQGPPAWTASDNTPPSRSSSIAFTANPSNSRTHLNRPISPASDTDYTITPSRSPMVNASLPKPTLPVRTTSCATSIASFQTQGGTPMKLDEEEKARRRKERERLYRQGFTVNQGRSENDPSWQARF